MTEQGDYHGGLVLYGPEDDILERLTRIAAATMEDYGHPVEKSAIVDGRLGRVVSTRYNVTLHLGQELVPGEHGQRGLRFENFKLFTPPERQHRVVVNLCPVDTAHDDRDISELLMVVMLYRACHEFDVQMVEWLDPLTLLTATEFLGAFANICPSLVKPMPGNAAPSEPRFAPLHEEPEDSEPAFAVHLEAVEVDPDQSDIRRLAIWGMTGMLAFLSTPVAISMATVNLVRGEDFRLNTHVLSLTGFVFTFDSTGALANAVAQLTL